MFYGDTFATLNRGGNDVDNPILENLKLTLRVHKQDASQAFRQCWVAVGQEVYLDLTAQAVETAEDVTVNITAGVELQASYPAVRNVVHFTFTGHAHAKQVVYVVTRPDALITLDGYNCNDATKPFIYPAYVEAP